MLVAKVGEVSIVSFTVVRLIYRSKFVILTYTHFVCLGVHF